MPLTEGAGGRKKKKKSSSDLNLNPEQKHVVPFFFENIVTMYVSLFGMATFPEVFPEYKNFKHLPFICHVLFPCSVSSGVVVKL